MTNGRCRLHGGLSLSGRAHPAFKHGRYSKHLPAGLAKLYKQSQNDPDLLSIAGEINLVDARLLELIAKLRSGECGAAWSALRNVAKEFRAAQQAKDGDAMAAALSEMLRLIDAGFGDWMLWKEVGDQVDRRARLVSQEHRRLSELEQMIPAENAMVLISAIVEVVRRNVTDRGTLQAISDEIRTIAMGRFGGGDLSAIPSGPGPTIDVGE